MDINDFSNHLQQLKAEKIDLNKCTVDTSFEKQILHNVGNRNTKAQERQQEQFKDEIKFNLGNGNKFEDALKAADYLLERELGDTFLFKDSKNPIFIPETFVSKLYKKDASYVDYDIMNHIRKTRDNCLKNNPNWWFTNELDLLLKNLPAGDCFSSNDFEEWIKRVKILYLIRLNGPKPSSSSLPHVTSDKCKNDIMGFIDLCKKYLISCDKNHQYSNDFKVMKKKESVKKWIDKQLCFPVSPEILNWFFKLNLTDISGELPEKSLYDKLNNAFHSAEIIDSKFIVLHASQILIDEFGKEQEFDFLLFSADRKLLIAIEVKRSCFNKKPFEQLKKYKDIFEMGLGDQFGNGWTYLPVVCIHNANDEMLEAVNDFPPSKIHFMHSETDVKDWMKSVCDKFPVQNFPESKGQLKNVVKILLFLLQMSTQPLKDDPSAPRGQIVHSKWADFIAAAIETISNTNNIVFYSKNQLPIFHSDDEKYKKLVLRGSYGSGKTFLFRAKAEQLAEDEQKVLFYIHKNTTSKTLLRISLEERWSDPKYASKIRILNEIDIKNSNMGELTQSLIEISKKTGEHIFIDEVLEMDRKEVNMFDVLTNKFVWISSVAKGRKNQSPVPTYETEELPHTLRNSGEVIEFARKHGEMIGGKVIMGLSNPLSNCPSGSPPKFVDSIKEVFKIWNVTELKGILVILSQNLKSKGKKAREIFKEMERFEVGSYFESYELQRLGRGVNIIKSDKCMEYLRNGVLMVDYKIAHGFEWKKVLLVSAKSERVDTNLILRCTTELVILYA